MATAKKKSTAKKSSAATKQSATGSRGKTASTGQRKQTTGSAAKKKTATSGGRQPNAAFMKAMQPDAELAAVVGNKPMPRTEITKKLWDYIKKNGLQDPNERRMINADDKLRPVFGGKKKVSMFDMTKLVNQHLQAT